MTSIMAAEQSIESTGRSLFRDRRVMAWAGFDFANTPFVVLVATIGFATYFTDVVAAGARSGDFLWGLAGSISMVLVALTAPATGAYADAAGAKRRLLMAYTAVAVVCTALLATVKEGMVLWGMLLFIAANVGFQGGQVFYNAFLPDVTGERTLGAVSGLGFAAGYLGALLSLLAALPFFWNGFDKANLGNVQVLFLFVAVFWTVFCIPTFVYLRDRDGPASGASRSSATVATRRTSSLARLREDISQLRRAHRSVFRYLVAYLLYMDAITTLTAFTAIYARDTIGLSLPQIISLYVISQFTAIPGSFVVGRLADRVGAKPTLSASLCVWLVIIALGVLARGYGTFVLIALLAGVATGALQSVSRSFMAQLSPRDREAEFFGFYAMVGRVSAIFGPLLFGAVSSLSGNQRPALASLTVLVAAGLWLLQGVRAPTPEPA